MHEKSLYLIQNRGPERLQPKNRVIEKETMLNKESNTWGLLIGYTELPKL